MAKDRLVFYGRVVLTNERAVRALEVIEDFLEDMLETFPDRQDVKRAMRAARYACRHLGVVPDEDEDE